MSRPRHYAKQAERKREPVDSPQLPWDSPQSSPQWDEWDDVSGYPLEPEGAEGVTE